MVDHERETVEEVLKHSAFASHDILRLLRLENFANTTVHVISHLDVLQWRIASYFPFTEEAQPTQQLGHQVLLMFRDDHYTLMVPQTSDTLGHNHSIDALVSAFREDCIARHGIHQVTYIYAPQPRGRFKSKAHQRMPVV